MTEYEVVIKHTEPAHNDGSITDIEIPPEAKSVNTQTVTSAPSIVAVTYLVPKND